MLIFFFSILDGGNLIRGRLLVEPLPPSFWAKTHPIKYISGDEEPGEGLPNLGDSPVSSSYSELRQVSLGLRQVVLGFWLSFVSLSG